MRRHEEVVQLMIEALVDGEFEGGLAMPPERDLAQRFGASRGTIREAIRSLREREMVEVVRGQGQRVRLSDLWRVSDALLLRAMLERDPDRELLTEAIHGHAVLLREAASRTTVIATDGDLRLMRERVEELDRVQPLKPRVADRDEQLLRAELEFYEAVFKIAGNRVLTDLAAPLLELLTNLRRERAADRDAAAARQCRRLLEAISSRDPEFVRDTTERNMRQLSRWLGAG